MTIAVQKQVLWLEVTVDDSRVMQRFECKKNFRSVETRALKREALLFLQMVEELSSVHKVEDKIELVLALERVVEVDKEWVVNLF